MKPGFVLAEIEAIYSHPRGVIGRMSDLEEAKGFRLIPWGASEPIPFTEFEWHDGVLSIDDSRKEVRIVAVAAQRPGFGAFRRLLSAIDRAGYRPVVVEPIGPQMIAILAQYRWRRTLVEHENEVVEEWRLP